MIGTDREVEILKKGGVGVIPTDTIYGLVASVFAPEAIERIYEMKGGGYNKPFVFLISSIQDLAHFRISLDDHVQAQLEEFWPGPVSIILPCPFGEFEYLHRGKESLAFRIPDDDDLREFLDKTGPLGSTGVNKQGEEAVKNIGEAKKMFGQKPDFYIDGGELENKSSTIISFMNGELEILRQGDFDIK